MPKFPSIPQLSIVVPVTRDLAAFERTLISVLENQPSQSEILVVHDGNYDDPYALADEVRLVACSENDLPGLVSAGADAARGRLVHVLAEGLQATSGWTDAALEPFDHFDCGAVTPAIRTAKTNELVAAGWSDEVGQLVCPRADLGQRGRVGCYLQASFWRRDLLRSLGKSCRVSGSVDATSDVYQRLTRRAGWTCDVADGSTVLSLNDRLPWKESALTRGRQLRASANHFGGKRIASFAAVAANLLRPSRLLESVGGLLAGDISSSIDASQVVACDDVGSVVKMPVGVQRTHSLGRRAA